MHLTIRADGGPEIGYGHLVRTGALAGEMLRHGHRITYATTTPDHVADVCPDGVETLQLPSRSDVSPLIDRLHEIGADAVLADSYPVDDSYQRAVRNSVPLAVVSDDTRHPICADALVNGNLYARTLDYEIRGDEPVRCLGPDYLLLRREITRLTAREPPWHEDPTRVLVTMGGSDLDDLTPTVLRAFDGFDLRVDAIVGPGFSEEQERDIRTVAAGVSTDVRIARDPDDLPERMFRADFAVSTASSTVYELLALGTPVVCQPIADNQDLIAVALEDRNAATVLNRDTGEEAFRRAIEKYVDDPTLRREHRELGRELVDGKGTERVANLMQDLIES
jgi:spore coat polysaccharide biosynthesis predicted glycosyltransferase SpsG